MKRRTFLGSTAALLVTGCDAGDVVCAIETRGTGPIPGAGLAPSAFAEAGRCSRFREDRQGPYYLCVDDFRQAIHEDRPGVPLTLGLRVLDGQCRPRTDVVIDVWHCDAGGHYSGFDADPDVPAGVGPPPEQTASRFCRGSQVTNVDGVVTFRTVFPGYYAGRPVHVHARLYLDGDRRFTTQLYVDETTTASLMARAPYDRPRETERISNDDAGVADEQLLRVIQTGDAAFVATVNLVVA